MHSSRLLFALCLLGASFVAHAQVGTIYQEDSSIHVSHYGQRRHLAWAGGFNSAQFVNADLDGDGLQDLVAFEWRAGTVRTFINRGSATAAAYRYEPRYARSFPECSDYIKMPDYNRDGVPDLVQRGVGGFAVYRGYYDVNRVLNFAFYKNLRFISPAFGDINAYTQSSDIPGVADIDGDGDIDFLGFDVQGSIIGLYKNCQVEQGAPKDSIILCNPTNCWGRIFQSFARSYVLNVIPAPGSSTCNTLGNFGCKGCDAADAPKTTRHSGNCLLVFDYDGDGDMDLLDGNISFPDMQLLINGRAQFGGPDSMIRQDSVWSAGGHVLHLPNWPAASMADWDGDGKPDLLITPHDYGGENYRCVHLYRNTGTLSSPVWSFSGDTAFVDQGIDMGTASIPVLYDYNKDGHPDLFVGSEGFYQPNGTLRSRIAYYENSVAGGISTLALQTNDFGGIFAENVSGAAPAFGDLNGDGLDDMVVGHTDGRLSFYRNMAPSNTVTPQWVPDQPLLRLANGDTIDVGYSATPYIYDIDGDGKPDLLIGNQAGRVAYYRNNSTGGLSLTLGNARLGDLKSNPANTFSGFSTLWIGKMDNTGADYLVMGNDEGRVVRYTGFQNGNVTGNYTLLTAGFSGISVGQRSAITLGDLDGDGQQEMIVGNSLGGLYLYKQGPVVGVPDVGAGQGAGITLAPNPAASTTLITWSARDYPGKARLEVFDGIGRIVRRETFDGSTGAAQITLGGLTPGVYSCRLSGTLHVNTKRLIVIQ